MKTKCAKRLLSAALCLLLCLSLFPALAADPYPDVNQNRLETALVCYLGFLSPKDGGFMPQDAFTNAEAAVAVANLYGIAPQKPEEVRRFYKDVSPSASYAGYLVALAEAQLLRPNGVDFFQPDKAASFAWFSQMLYDFAGYGEFGGAKRPNLAKGVKDAQNLTRADAVTMFYNTLICHRLEVAGISEDGRNLRQSEETILEQDYSLYIDEAFLEANEFTRLDSPQSGLGKGEVSLAGKGVFRLDGGAEQLLGCQIRYFYHKDTNRILFACPKDGVTTMVTLSLDEADFDGGSVVENETQKKYRLDDGYAAILNGVCGGGTGLFGSAQGTATLVDNNGDRRFDVIRFEVFTVHKVESLDLSNETVSLSGGKTVKLENVTDASGETCDAAGLSGAMVLLYESAGGEKQKAVLLSETVSGEITKIGKDFIVIDETSYSLSDTGGLALGSVVTAYLWGGKIVHITKTSEAGFKYGYLVDVGAPKGFLADEIQIKMYSQEGKLAIFQADSGLSINGAKKDGGYTAGDIRAMLMANGSIDQLVRYSQRADGTIWRLDIYYDNTIPAGGTGYDTARFSKDFDAGTYFRASITSDRFYAKSTTIAFTVPTGDMSKATEADFSVGNYMQVVGDTLSDASKTRIVMYDADEFYGAGVMLIYKELTPSLSNYERVAVIDDVGTQLDADDNPCILLSLYINGKKTEVPVEDASRNLISYNLYNGDAAITQHDLKKGDAITYTQDKTGQIVNIALLARMESKNAAKGYFNRNYTETPDVAEANFNSNMPFLAGFGKVTKKNGTMAFLNIGAFADANPPYLHALRLGGYVYVVDSARGKISVETVDSVRAGDIVLTRSHVRDMYEIVIYR